MNTISKIRQEIFRVINSVYTVSSEQIAAVEIKVNTETKDGSFGDLSCNAALVLAKVVGQNPRQVAENLKVALLPVAEKIENNFFAQIDIAGPGFLNFTLTNETWRQLATEIFTEGQKFFKLDKDEQISKYLVEFVSANPTGPLHLGHGRGGIIGDVLSNVLKFLGHVVHKEFYINDAGSQINVLGKSFKVRCRQALGRSDEMPEKCYAGEYLIEMAKECITEYGESLLNKEDSFFQNYAKEHLLQLIKHDLKNYGIQFDEWFSEKSLHDSGVVNAAVSLLMSKDMAYEADNAIWFRSTLFGDDKDRVLKKSDGELTYIASDIAYHKDKFDRGYDKLINIWGQDHHGYVKRLKATMQALGYDSNALDVILYQLVTIKQSEEVVRMSKRAGTYTKLSDVIETVGSDIARFFYLNRKADAHLEFDIDTALKKTDENPVFYIQYAYVRINSILNKAEQENELIDCLRLLKETGIDGSLLDIFVKNIGPEERSVIKKIITLQDALRGIAKTYQTHVLAYYALELATKFHTYYANNKVVDSSNITVSKSRLFVVILVKQTLEICLDLLGLNKPEKM